MFKIDNEDIKKYECIAYRELGNSSSFVVQKLYKDNDEKFNPYFYFDLNYALANPIVTPKALNKEEVQSFKRKYGKGFKIGIVSEDKFDNINHPIKLYTRLAIEYDNESKDKNLINKFKSKFKDYSYVLYTTFSHRMSRPKFRVIIDLSYPLLDIHLNNVAYKEYLTNLFTLDKEKPDKSCFDYYQLQLLPITDRPSIYKYYCNDGRRLKLESLKSINKKEEFLLNKAYHDFVFPDLYKIYKEIYLDKCKVLNIDYEERNKKLDLIKSYNGKNFNETKLYKEASKRLKRLCLNKLKTDFSSKFEFNKYYASLVVNDKISSLKAQSIFKKIYGKDMINFPETYKDFQKCLNKFTKRNFK